MRSRASGLCFFMKMKSPLIGSPQTFRRLLFVGVALLVACKKTPPTTPPEQSSNTTKAPDQFDGMREFIKSKGLSPEREKVLLLGVDDDERRIKQGEIDHEELVDPTPPGFKPEAAKRKIRLALTLEKTMLRTGEEPRFLLEMTNIGSAPIRYLELGGSFFKSGVLAQSNDIQFILVPPAGKEIELRTGLPKGSIAAKEIVFPADWSRQKKERAVSEMNSQAKAAHGLSILLMPGETLRTRGDAPGDRFRTMRAHIDFTTVGTHRIRAEFDSSYLLKRIAPWMSRASKDAALKLRAEDSMGRIKSNEIQFEVLP